MNRRTFFQQTGAALAAGALHLVPARPGLRGRQAETVLLQSALANDQHRRYRPYPRDAPDPRAVSAGSPCHPLGGDAQRAGRGDASTPVPEGRDSPRKPAEGRCAEEGSKEKDAFSRADLFLRNSGMGTDTTSMAYCRKIGKPYGLYGQSYFPAFVAGDKARASGIAQRGFVRLLPRESH